MGKKGKTVPKNVDPVELAGRLKGNLTKEWLERHK